MAASKNFLAVDLGASSGRVLLGRWDGNRFGLQELHRFANGGVVVLGHLHWDVLRLWQELLAGLARYAAAYDAPLAGIGIDSWAVDYGLLDGKGRLLGNPYHYRDQRYRRRGGAGVCAAALDRGLCAHRHPTVAFQHALPVSQHAG